ncbi:MULTISPECIES: SufE family protein [unclassified Aureimonas]|uniref:SufE family protein n=1 Tax=unclassified Aureimonas TaxID=2615206 RepID=UPI0006FF297D|nr:MULTISPECIES: SufE family protein [unclassified Aureimonas]KQT55254.1 cysteine desufuration protein SufE [Aureimonas sp. Leaf427]KQT71045.1 cysteine desufuration protein SufE [Aureimonas sp. Leaf460]
MQTIDDIKADFELLDDDWEERYRYVIELGRQLPPMPDGTQTDETKVRGCVSQVWLTSEIEPGCPPRIRFQGDSDAHIVKGLVAIAIALYSGRTPGEILLIDAEATFDDLGLREHLTPQRSNGLRSMVARIREDAAKVQAPA